MNLFKELTTEEKGLLEKIGINIANRDCSKSELREYEVKIEDFIMLHSTKNGDIDKIRNQYNKILNLLIK